MTTMLPSYPAMNFQKAWLHYI